MVYASVPFYQFKVAAINIATYFKTTLIYYSRHISAQNSICNFICVVTECS